MFQFAHRYSPIHQTCSDTFAIVTLVPVAIHVPNAVKHLPHSLAWSSTRTSIRRWNRFSARFASKRTRNSRICVVTSACTPIVACKSNAPSAARVSAQWPRYRSISAFVIPPAAVVVHHRLHRQRPLFKVIIQHLRQHRKHLHRHWGQVWRSYHEQWQVHRIRFSCFPDHRHSFRTASDHTMDCSECSRIVRHKRHPFQCYFHHSNMHWNDRFRLDGKHQRDKYPHRMTIQSKCHRQPAKRPPIICDHRQHGL